MSPTPASFLVTEEEEAVNASAKGVFFPPSNPLSSVSQQVTQEGNFRKRTNGGQLVETLFEPGATGQQGDSPSGPILVCSLLPG